MQNSSIYSFSNYLLLSISFSLCPNHSSFLLGDLRHSVEPNEVQTKLGSIILPTYVQVCLCLTPLLLLLLVWKQKINVSRIAVRWPFTSTFSLVWKLLCWHSHKHLSNIWYIPGSDPWWEHIGEQSTHRCCYSSSVKVQEGTLLLPTFPEKTRNIEKEETLWLFPP